MIKINLGCGAKHRPSPWVNCDISPWAKPDFLFDFGRDPWPFAAQSADEISAIHSLEHSTGLVHVMIEAYRVLIPGGKFEIEVPHPRSDLFIGDPTHVMPVTQIGLDLFNKSWCEDCLTKGFSNTPLALHHGVDFRMVSSVNHLSERWIEHLLDKDGNIINSRETAYVLATHNNVVNETRFVLERM